MGLNKDELIYKLIFGISIYGAAWSYDVKQLQIGVYISYRLVENFHTLYIINDSILFLIIIHTVTYHSNPQSLYISCLCLLFHIILIYLIVSFSMYGVYSWL